MLGKTLTGRYKIIKQLGGGGFSQTFIAEDCYLPDHPSCVIKQLKPASSQDEILAISRQLFDKEAKVLYRLGKHECIPSLLAHFEEDEEFFLAQELVQGNVLTQEIKHGNCLGEQYTLDFLVDILSTLDFVHRQQVIHRDIKPSNLIRRLSDRKIVLIDFGAVKEVSTQPISQLGHTSSLVIGSPGYMPNEQYSGKTFYASDIYAIGVIAIQCLTGLMPNQIPEDPVTSEFRWHDLVQVTPDLAMVIDRMVRFDFRQRYQTVQEVITSLQPLLTRSLAPTIFSGFSSSNGLLVSELNANESVHNAPEQIDSPNAPVSLANNHYENQIIQLIREVADDLEMSEDPVRAKKLICLVCTGILENDLERLNNFSFEELLQDLHQQFATVDLLRENLVKVVKTIAIPKQRQYLIVAKMVYKLITKLYQDVPSVDSIAAVASPSVPPSGMNSPVAPVIVSNPVQAIQVSRLVINAESAQLVTSNSVDQDVPVDQSPDEPPLEFLPELPLMADPAEYSSDDYGEMPISQDLQDLYDWVVSQIDLDAQQMRIKKLLFYAYQDVWESDLRQLNSIDWSNLLRELVSFMPSYEQLTTLIEEAVQRVSKPKEYGMIGTLLLKKLEPLYFQEEQNVGHREVLPIYPESDSQSLTGDSAAYKVPFDPQIVSDLFNLRLELMRFTNPMRVKILLFSCLYYRFDVERDKWQDLHSHSLDSLLRQIFYMHSSLADLENAIWKMARSLSDSIAYEQSANYIIQALQPIYTKLDEQSMLHPTANKLSELGDSEFTQPDLNASNEDDDTCQFIVQ
ncbi:MAG: serine/threonine-protein kinase [Pseudanabaenaceae cyanobacterium bins.39]|nr:serine/threonine-protein kinase [Pseudanabaenaceae cyanobacterium bins.39]